METNPTIQKTIEPKVYGLVLESRETIFLSIQYAYSLEEAFILAKLEFETQNPIKRGINNPLIGSKIGLFTIKTVAELTAPSNMLNNMTGSLEDANKILEGISSIISAQGLPPDDISLSTLIPDSNVIKADNTKLKTSPGVEKNNLMRQIIKEKNAAAFEKNKGLFTPAERAYLRGHLK